MELVFKKDKETDRKIRFNLQTGPVVGTIYVEKEKAGDRTEVKATVDLE